MICDLNEYINIFIYRHTELGGLPIHKRYEITSTFMPSPCTNLRPDKYIHTYVVHTGRVICI